MSDKPQNTDRMEAFPRAYGDHSGMELRDWFAGQILSNSSNGVLSAKTCYELADKMMAERLK